MKPVAREALRALRAPAIVLVLYLCLRAAFDRLTERGGLLSPSGDVSPGVALLGVVVLALRIAVLFVVPAAVAYGLLVRLIPGRAHLDLRKEAGVDPSSSRRT
jgi:hypothetical protein